MATPSPATAQLAVLEANYQTAMRNLSLAGSGPTVQAMTQAAMQAREALLNHIAISNANGAKGISQARVKKAITLINNDSFRLNMEAQSVFDVNGIRFNSEGYFYTPEEIAEMDRRANQNAAYDENRVPLSEREGAKDRDDPIMAQQELQELREATRPQRTMRATLVALLGATALVALGPVGLGVGGIAAAALAAGGGTGFLATGLMTIATEIRNRRNMEYQMDKLAMINDQHAIAMSRLQEDLEKAIRNNRSKAQIDRIKKRMERAAESQIKQNLKYASRAAAMRARLENQRRDKIRDWLSNKGHSRLADKHQARIDAADAMLDFANQNIAKKVNFAMRNGLQLGVCAQAALEGDRASWFQRNVWMSNKENSYARGENAYRENKSLYENVVFDTIQRDSSKIPTDRSLKQISETILGQCQIPKEQLTEMSNIKMAMELYNRVPGVAGTQLGKDIMKTMSDAIFKKKEDGNIFYEIQKGDELYDPAVAKFFKEHIDEIAPKAPQPPAEVADPGAWTGGPKRGKKYLEWKAQYDAFDKYDKEKKAYDADYAANKTKYDKMNETRATADAALAAMEEKNPQVEAEHVVGGKPNQAAMEAAARQMDAEAGRTNK